MKIIALLEALANKPHYSIELKSLVQNQPKLIKKAIETKDVALLRKHLPSTIYLANMTTVVKN